MFLVVWAAAGRPTSISPLTAAGCCAQRSVSNSRKGSSLVQLCHDGSASSFAPRLPSSFARHYPEELSPPGGSHREAKVGRSAGSEAQVEHQMALRSHAPVAGDTDKLLAGSPEAPLTFACSAVWLLFKDDTGDSWVTVWMQWSGRLCTDQWRAKEGICFHLPWYKNTQTWLLALILDTGSLWKEKQYHMHYWLGTAWPQSTTKQQC